LAIRIREAVGIATVLVLLGNAPVVRAGDCDEYIQEADALEGASARFNPDGSLRAIMMYGEATFLTPKRSLISSARRKAEMKAKRSFSEWMKESLHSETLATDMMETVQETDQDGNTTGMARELETQLNTMRSNTSAVLSGIVKLDECVDTDAKVVLVQLGWKPSMSGAAADTKQAIASATKRGDQPSKAPTNTAATSTSSEAGKSGSGIRIIVVEVEGNGTDLKRATNEALRSAIAQVFGEQFAAETETEDLTNTAEVSTAGMSIGVAVEQSSERNAVSSKTKGLIQSYEYISKQEASHGMTVFLRVSLPKYESSLDPNKTRAIVLRPKLSQALRGSGDDMDVFIEPVQDTLESLLNQSRKMTVLDREFIKDQMRELNFVASGNSPVSELARLGNTAGADTVVISEIVSYSQELDRRQLGNQTIERTVFNAEIAVKVIDVATTNILFSQRFPFRNQKIKASNPASGFGQRVGDRLARRVAGKLGGGLQRGASAGFAQEVDVGASAKRANKSFNEAKESVKDEW